MDFAGSVSILFGNVYDISCIIIYFASTHTYFIIKSIGGEEVKHSAIFQHSCNKFRDDGESKSQSKRDADRYVHCYVRFEAHGKLRYFQLKGILS